MEYEDSAFASLIHRLLNRRVHVIFGELLGGTFCSGTCGFARRRSGLRRLNLKRSVGRRLILGHRRGHSETQRHGSRRSACDRGEASARHVVPHKLISLPISGASWIVLAQFIVTDTSIVAWRADADLIDNYIASRCWRALWHLRHEPSLEAQDTWASRSELWGQSRHFA